MGIEGHPFPMNIVASSYQGKVKILTSDRAKTIGAVDPEKQISAEEYQEMERKRKDSQYDHPRTSRTGEMRRHPTVRILLNKWQC